MVRRVLLSTAIVALAAFPACKCGKGPGLVSKAPVLAVDPAALFFQPIPAGRSAVAIVAVQNAGNEDLHLARDPWVAFTSGVAEYSLTSMLERDCTGAARTGAARLTLSPGECARVVVRYAPQEGGDGKAQLNLASDDPAHGTVAVPIALGEPARLVLCTLKADGTEDSCDSEAGQPPLVEFGLVARGQSALRKVRIKNAGRARLENLAVKDPDGPMGAEFQRSAGTPVALEPGQAADLTIRFAPAGGGPRLATVEIDSGDPKRPAVQLPLRGVASGPALCADPSPLEFGQANLGQKKDLPLTLTSCGNAPVQLRQVALDALSSAAFGAPSLPAPQTLAPGQKLQVHVIFQPLEDGDETGALLVPNDGQPGQYVKLHGTAKVAPACRLEAAVASIDFGQVVRGQTAERSLTVANRGQVVCNLAKVSIATGASYFSVLQPPTQAIQLRPGDAFTTGVRYAPPVNDANSSDSGSVEYDSDDPLHPAVTVALSGNAAASPVCKLQITPSSGSTGSFFGRTLQFGNVVVGRSKTLPVVFKNVGSAACSLAGFRFISQFGNPLTGGGCASASSCNDFHLVSPYPASVQPGQSAQLQVSFTPMSTGQVQFIPFTYLFADTGDKANSSECVQGFSPDLTNGCISVGMSGQGDISNLEVIPSDLDFGLITLGCRARQQTVTLYNTGASTSFTIKSFAIDPATSPFYLQAPPTPFTMKPGAHVPLQVTYKPTLAARENALLKIETDASNASSNNPYVTVALAGTGTTDKHQRDTFGQATVPKVDMLFIIDDSGSFDFYQKQLSDQASKFVAAALKANADFHIGVGTNDVVEQKTDGNASYQGTIYPGGLYGEPLPQGYISNTTPDPAGQFSKNVRVGTGGTAQREAGLEVAWDTLRAPYRLKPAPQGSAGFLRDDARLVVIDVQDDDDESNGSTGFYIDFFKSLKGQYNAGLVSFNAIGSFDEQTGQPKQCVSGSSEPGGERYYAVAQGTGGKTWSVCNADWAAIADQLALGAFSGRKQFPLSRNADPATVVVTVNGAVQAARDYVFDQASNSVVFSSVPPPGATIVVDYDALCL